MIEIKNKIVGYKLVSTESKKESVVEDMTPYKDILTEDTQRPEYLVGSTYKVKTPLSDHAMYITINDIVLNQGTEHESKRPFEIFINSKGVEHFQWVVAFTRIISAVFRKGGDVNFLSGELKSIFDPKGGYFKNGKYMPSLVAEIGDVIDQHLKKIDATVKDNQPIIKVEPVVNINNTTNTAKLCSKCSEFAVYIMDGCPTCTNCGDSKCG